MALDKALLAKLTKFQKEAEKLVFQNKRLLQTMKKVEGDVKELQRQWLEEAKGPQANNVLNGIARVRKEMDACEEGVGKRGGWGRLHEAIDSLLNEIKRSQK